MLFLLLPQAAACPAPVAPPAGWIVAGPVVAGATAAKAPVLAIGRGASATLVAQGAMTLASPLEKPARPGDHGGLFVFTVATQGRYRVALGGAAWVDVVKDGRAIASADHGHGADCSQVRKVVAWDLQPGRYLLQVAGSEAATLRLELIRG